MRQLNDQPDGRAEDAAFPFLGGAMSLDLVNTEVVIRGKPLDLVATAADLGRWWTSASRSSEDHALTHVQGRAIAFDDVLLDATKRLRAALRGLFAAAVGRENLRADDLMVLNEALGLGRQRLEQSAGGELQTVYHVGEETTGGLLLPIARSAARLLTDVDQGRLHACRNERCVLFFYDSTRSATRLWCSLGCMNRARSVERYRLSKAGLAP